MRFKKYRYFDDMQVLPVQEFIRQLHAGEIFSKV
jgi:hypothetical protein